MADHKTLVFEDFAGKVGEVFTIKEENLPTIAMTLTEAQPLSPAINSRAARSPFSLIFLAQNPCVLPQRIYHMEHNGLGELAIFVVPVGKNADGVIYQATFN